jgi:hypothetical protein
VLLAGRLQAHDVVWWESPFSFFTGAMDFCYPSEFYDFVGVLPSSGEPCTVVVKLDPPTSTLVNAQVLPPNPDNEVYIGVQVMRAPTGAVETATISGRWYATGYPDPVYCDATNQMATNQVISIPIAVFNSPLEWHVLPAADQKSIAIDAGINCALQAAASLAGPWLIVGQGQTFTVNSEMPSGFFQRLKKLGGAVTGTVTDQSGNPLTGVTLSLPLGGPAATTDAGGYFALPRLAWGMNLIAISNAIGAVLNIAIPATNNIAVGIKAAMAAAPPATSNACNCTPWCAIGFATLPGGQTPVYYAGGANPPKVGPANCGQPQVIVTRPDGYSSPITAGTGRDQNSGPNPASAEIFRDQII